VALYHAPVTDQTEQNSTGLLTSLKRRGVLRVAASYALIAWLLLQIGDVVVEPLGIGTAAMRVLMLALALGFPVALALAWFFEFTPQGLKLDQQPADAARPSVGGVRRYADLLIIGVLVVVVAVLVARQGGLIEEQVQTPVLAVLPFTNMSPEAEDAYFGEGLADTLVQKLGQLSELVVLATQSTFEFRGRDLNLKQVGGKLGATAIMTGSVQRSGDTLRINARLVEPESGKQLWAGSFDRRLQDVFAIQDDIAASVTESLRLALAPESRERLASHATSSLGAYDAYVLGINRLAARTYEDRKQALGYFRQAIAADPDYALAYSGLVEALFLYSSSGLRTEPVEELRAEADEAASRALELDPNLGEAWLARALVALIDREYRTGAELPDADIIAFFEKAIELSPNNAMAHKYFANFEPISGTDRGVELLMRAARLDPRSGIIKINIGEGLIRQGKPEQAEHWFREAVRTQKPYFTLGFAVLVNLHLEITGRLDEAGRLARAWRIAGPDDGIALTFEDDAYFNLGAWDQARDGVERLASAAAAYQGSDRNIARWGELNQGMLMARRSGDWDTVVKLGRRMSAEIWENGSDWPVLQRIPWHSPSMTTLALAEIRDGRIDEALARFEAAYPGPFERINPEGNDLLGPVVMRAALQKQAGNRTDAGKLLQDYLRFIRQDTRWSVFTRPGWTEFTILAMLGETDAALAALEKALDSGYIYQWYMLKDGVFDPDYAAVIADPRFEALYTRITARVDQMREAFLANPELPEGYLR
jgi:adenylate cyclase